MPKWIFTGSTGLLGSQVLEHALKLGLNPQDIILSVYNSKAVNEQLAKTVSAVRHGDFNQIDTLEKAFQGGEILFFVSSSTVDTEKRTAEHRNVVNAAKKAGIQYIFYTSLAFGSSGQIQLMQAHLNTEELLKQSGLKYTIIREGVYSECFPLFLGYFDANQGEEILLPADGEMTFVAQADLAEATAKILLAPLDTCEKQTITLTGQLTFTLMQIASIIGRIFDRKVPVKVVSLDEYTAELCKNHDEAWVRMWVTVFPGLQRGELKPTDPIIEKILGRQPKPLEETIEELIMKKKPNSREEQLYSRYLQASNTPV